MKRKNTNPGVFDVLIFSQFFSLLITWSRNFFFFNCLENCLSSARLFLNRTLLTSCCNYSKATSPVSVDSLLSTALRLTSSGSKEPTILVKAWLSDWQPGGGATSKLPALSTARHSWLLVFNVVGEGTAGLRGSSLVDGRSCVQEALPQHFQVRCVVTRLCYTNLTILKLKYVIHNLGSKDKNVG